MTEHSPTVFLVDDDEAVRDSLGLLMKSVALHSRSYASADDFLADFDPDSPGCLVLDIRMPGMSGITLLERLKGIDRDCPVVMLTAVTAVSNVVAAMRRSKSPIMRPAVRRLPAFASGSSLSVPNS